MTYSYKNIVKFGLIINIIIYLYSLIYAFDRPFWIDELHVIGVSNNIFNISLKQVFIENILHPPLFFYLVGFFNFFFENLYFLRLVNALGLIPLIYSLILLKRYFKNINLNFILLLIISNYIFFYYSIELKMYFLIYCLSFLQHTIFLIDVKQKKFKFLFFILCLLMTSIHIFGLVISMSILLIYGIISLKDKNLVNFFYNLISSIILIFLFAIMFYYSTLDVNNFKAMSWIAFQKWYFRAFLEWSIPIGLSSVVFFLIVFLKNNIFNFFNFNSKSNFNLNIFYITLPSIILLITTIAISLKTPVITHRNLIVIAPAGILLCGLLSLKFFKYKGYELILTVLILITTYCNFFIFKNNAIYTTENIEWVINKTYKKDCKNVPIYFNDNKKILFKKMTNNAIDIYAKYFRELRRLSDLDIDTFNQLSTMYPKCDIFIASFHEWYFERNLKKIFFNKTDLDIVIAPNVLDKNTKSGAILISQK
ncbi:hypothetical protein OAB10_05295 [Candidatus Pelagibacter sp.]|nr:hypothetical protein [Candidatus Pelagibacter sp.]